MTPMPDTPRAVIHQPTVLRPLSSAICVLLSAIFLPACSPPKPELVAPRVLVAPYDAAQGERLWAVLPLRNESGTTVVDSKILTDKLIAATEQIRGVRVVPLNRVLQAMTSLKMASVSNPTEARQLGSALGVDAVVVGSITAYDPYTPTLGMALALFSESGPNVSESLAPQSLATQTSDLPPKSIGAEPMSTTSAVFDGKSHETQMQVRQFAIGRSQDTTALAWRRYLASAELFGEFAAYQIMDDLLRSEWVRSGRAGASDE